MWYNQIMEIIPEKNYQIFYIDYLNLRNYWKTKDGYACRTVGFDQSQDYLDLKSTDTFWIAKDLRNY